MCGILGRLSLSPPDADRLSAALDTMRHRGPDDRGVLCDSPVWLGHRRLAIIDLSPAGRQPMTRGRLSITYNGEIYNYLELRAELNSLGHHFSTGTDTEVVLAAFDQWGEDCVRRFNGMWGLAIWDARSRRLFCSRDRLGVKPFYYQADGDTLIFASEIKAILSASGTIGRPCRQAVADYLRNGYSCGPATWFSGVLKLPAGHNLTAEIGPDGRLAMDLRRYWRPPEDEGRSVDLDELFFLLDDAVRLRLRSDVPVGFHLSGGLDSSLVTALAARRLPGPARAFSGYFTEEPRLDERPWIARVARHLGAESSLIRITAADFQAKLGRLMRLMDHPEAGASSLAQHQVNGLMRQSGVVVSLGGQGGDETGGGYYHYLPSWLRSLWASGAWRAMSGALRFAGDRHLWAESSRRIRRLGQPGAMSRLLHPALAREVEEVRYGWSQPLPLAERLRRDLTDYLPALLHVEDRTSMAFSLESRLPFLDYRLVEALCRLEAIRKIDRGRLKWLSRRMAARILPLEVADRRDKVGFNSPLESWFRGPLAGWLRDAFIDREPRASREGFIEGRRLRDFLLSRRPDAETIWRVLALETWLGDEAS